MPRVTGEFNVILPTPIVAAQEVIEMLCSHNHPDSIKLNVNASDVMASLGETTPLEEDDYGNPIELPRIASLSVWITREARTQCDANGREILLTYEEELYEEILVESLRRLTSAIKDTIGQSGINTRHPIRSYSSRYHREDRQIGTEFAWPRRSFRIPKYAYGSFFFTDSVSDSLGKPGALDLGIWDSVQSKVHIPFKLPVYDELIHDAAVYRSEARYQLAALSSSIAVELMLKEICRKLLRRQGNLHDEQIDAILSERRVPSLVYLIRSLSSNLNFTGKEIQQVSRIRNEIAHGETRDTDEEKLRDVLNITYKVRNTLESL